MTISNTRAQGYLQELLLEYKATRGCLERIPESLFDYKPHPRSMTMGYLSLLVAEIPLWIKYMVSDGEELVDHFEENMAAARKALEMVTDEVLEASFSLKANGKVLYTSKKIVDIGITLNHWVHHRGQLTVYMRLNDIAVPSIYGPSADDRNFTVPR